MVWKLPYEVNQRSIAGRNGSCACSLIALVIGHLVHAFHVTDPVNGLLNIEWINLLVRSMELGNKIYDEFWENLPFRYLSTAEACEIMSGIFNLIPDRPLPLHLEDSHRQSTIAAQLECSWTIQNIKLQFLPFQIGVQFTFCIHHPFFMLIAIVTSPMVP